jgi:acyl dehydratase
VAVNPEAVGLVTPPQETSWDSKDCLLYALGVGAGATDPTGAELDLTTENSTGTAQRVLPTFPVVVTAGAWTIPELGDFDRALLVHASQALTLDGPVPTEGRVRWTTRIAGIWDKGTAAVVDTETEAVDASTGERRWRVASSVFIKGQGGWGGPRGSSPRAPAPAESPDLEVRAATRPDQALLYRLSGDRNPLHSDPTFAARGGFDQPILHGLCTYGFTGRLLLHALCDSDPGRFRSMSGRFSRPVLPGQELVVAIWRGKAGEASFRTTTESGTVIDDGVLIYAQG